MAQFVAAPAIAASATMAFGGSGEAPVSPRNAPAANSSESPGSNGRTTKPVSTMAMQAIRQVPSSQFCASTQSNPIVGNPSQTPAQSMSRS